MSAFTVSIDKGVNAAGRPEYTVTTSTGYRATIEGCDRDDCRGSLPDCRRALNHRGQHNIGTRSGVDAWLKHARVYCRGWYDGRVADFAQAVRKTHGSARRLRSLDTVRARTVARLAPEVVAAELGITVDDYRAELARAAA